MILAWMVFELGLPVCMVLGAPVVYPLGYSMNMLPGLALDNCFGTREEYLVGFSLGTLVCLMI